MIRFLYFYHRCCLGCRRLMEIMPEEAEVIDVESREGKKMVKLYGIGAVPAMVIVIEGREWIEAFCKGWHGEEEDAQD